MPIHPIKHTAEKIGTKPFIIMLLVLLMLIPLHMIRSIITDREFYRDQAIHSVLLPKGGQPVLEGLAAAKNEEERAEYLRKGLKASELFMLLTGNRMRKNAGGAPAPVKTDPKS